MTDNLPELSDAAQKELKRASGGSSSNAMKILVRAGLRSSSDKQSGPRVSAKRIREAAEVLQAEEHLDLVDSSGQEIPVHLRAAFASRDELASIVLELARIQQRVAAIRRMGIPTLKATVDVDLRNAGSAISFAIPDRLCQDCRGGSGSPHRFPCRTCRAVGYLTSAQTRQRTK